MLVDNALEVRREDDQVVGLLLPTGKDWLPATVFGAALGPATDQSHAESVVLERGLSSLAERWWARIQGEPWREAWLLEVKPDRIRLRWDNPMLMSGGRGEWHRVAELEIQRDPPD